MFKKLKKYWYNFTHPIIGEVWELHRVTSCRSQDKRYAPYDMSPQRLESLIVDYKKRGYTFVSIEEIRSRLLNVQTWCKAICASKCVAITLDDGYRDNYENAYPIFKKYDVPFCIYVTTGYIGGTFNAREDKPLSLTNEQIKELDADSLCTLGAHTVTHAHLCRLYAEDMKNEINDSIVVLQNILGHNIAHFAVPYGEENEEVIAILEKNGITSNVNAWGGAVRMGCDMLKIPRYIIEEDRIVK